MVILNEINLTKIILLILWDVIKKKDLEELENKIKEKIKKNLWRKRIKKKNK